MGRTRDALDAASAVFRLDAGPPVQDVSPLSLAVEHYRSAAADRGLDKALESSSVAFRKRLDGLARAKREALFLETVEQLDRLTVLVTDLAERYRKQLFDLASERELAPREIDALKDRFRQEIEDLFARAELAHEEMLLFGRKSEPR